jgi:thiamine biosynthesis lipoprotein
MEQVEPFDEQFDAMGARIRIVIGEPGERGLASPQEAGRQARSFIDDFDRRLSRFRPDSELTAMNRDPGTEIPASDLLRTAVKAGLWAARRSGGLVDPTLLDEIEAAGYRDSRAGMSGLPAPEALADAPGRRSAAPGQFPRWEECGVDVRRKVIHRPSGLKFDTGGTGKGLAADLVAESLQGYSRYLVSCGGDIRIGGREAAQLPFDVWVEHPVSGRRPHLFRLGTGGVATSGINVRAWRTPDGRVAHHLLDPSTGKPCWSGLIGATALGRTALEAETLAKAAVLSGPEGGRTILSRHGGLIVHESNRVEPVGSNRVRFRIPEIRPNKGRAAA